MRRWHITEAVLLLVWCISGCVERPPEEQAIAATVSDEMQIKEAIFRDVSDPKQVNCLDVAPEEYAHLRVALRGIDVRDKKELRIGPHTGIPFCGKTQVVLLDAGIDSNDGVHATGWGCRLESSVCSFTYSYRLTKDRNGWRITAKRLTYIG